MFKFLFNIFLLFLALSSCTSKGKLKNPVDFTPRIIVGNVIYDYKLDEPISINKWLSNTGNPENITLDQFKQFDSFSILENNIACDPIIIDESECNMYVLDQSSFIYKIGCNTNPKALWKYKLLQDKTKYYGGAISLHNDKLYITNGSRYVFIINATNGEYILEKKLPDIVLAKPLVDKNIIYLQDVSNNIYALNETNGDFVWQNRSNIGEMLINQFDRQLWLYKDEIISLSSNGMLQSLNKLNGSRLWQIELFNNKDNDEHVVIRDFSNKGCLFENSLYVSNSDGYLYNIDVRNGSIIYKVKIANVQTISKNGNLIIVTNSANQVIALDPKNGKFIWSTDLFKSKIKDIAYIQTPQMFNDLLYVITDKQSLVKIDPTNGKINSDIKIPKGSSAYGSISGKLYIFSKKSVAISRYSK